MSDEHRPTKEELRTMWIAEGRKPEDFDDLMSRLRPLNAKEMAWAEQRAKEIGLL